jgi:hypothetical protein
VDFLKYRFGENSISRESLEMKQQGLGSPAGGAARGALMGARRTPRCPGGHVYIFTLRGASAGGAYCGDLAPSGVVSLAMCSSGLGLRGCVRVSGRAGSGEGTPDWWVVPLSVPDSPIE